MSDQQSWPTRDAAVQVAAGFVAAAFEAARDEIRELAHAAAGDEQRPVREAYINSCFVLDRHRDLVLAGPVEREAARPPELASGPPAEWPLIRPVQHPSVPRWRSGAGAHRGQP